MYFVIPVGQGYRVGEVVSTAGDKWLTIEHLDHFFGSYDSAKKYIKDKFGADKDVTNRIVQNYEQIRTMLPGR